MFLRDSFVSEFLALLSSCETVVFNISEHYFPCIGAVKLLFQFVLMKLDFFQSPCASFLRLVTTSHVPMSSCDSSHLPYCVTFFKNNEHKKINRKKKQPH